MRIYLLILIYFGFFSSCNDRSLFSVSRIIDGNSIELTNGVVVVLDGVQNNEENIKILERYTAGGIHLYDKDDGEILHLNFEKITAIIYNTDGDCVNDLLKGVTRISKTEVPELPENKANPGRTYVKMNLEGGVYTIPVYVNNVLMSFIFDTGASLISISTTEASILYKQGSLTKEDILGKGQFTDANGDISEGTIIKLKTIKIGDRILHDVLATVVDGQNVPLLFGQSALQKFGRVSIDYTRNEITFE